MRQGFRIVSLFSARLDSSSRPPSLFHPLITKYRVAPRPANVPFDILITSIDGPSDRIACPGCGICSNMPPFRNVTREKRSCSLYREGSCLGNKTDILIFRTGEKRNIFIPYPEQASPCLSRTWKDRTRSTRINNLMFAFLFSFVNRVDIKAHFSLRRKNKDRSRSPAKYIIVNCQRRLQFVKIFFSLPPRISEISSRRRHRREVGEINIPPRVAVIDWRRRHVHARIFFDVKQSVTRENTWQRQSDEASLQNFFQALWNAGNTTLRCPPRLDR